MNKLWICNQYWILTCQPFCYENYVINSYKVSYLLQSLTCQHLDIGATDLSSEENSRALLDAIRERVENLCLDSETTVTFSILEEYDGQGACKKITFRGDTRGKYGRDAKTWAMNVGWYWQSDGDIICSYVSPAKMEELKKIKTTLRDTNYYHYPLLEEVKSIANLAVLGHLAPGSVNQLHLRF